MLTYYCCGTDFIFQKCVQTNTNSVRFTHWHAGQMVSFCLGGQFLTRISCSVDQTLCQSLSLQDQLVSVQCCQISRKNKKPSLDKQSPMYASQLTRYAKTSMCVG